MELKMGQLHKYVINCPSSHTQKRGGHPCLPAAVSPPCHQQPCHWFDSCWMTSRPWHIYLSYRQRGANSLERLLFPWHLSCLQANTEYPCEYKKGEFSSLNSHLYGENFMNSRWKNRVANSINNMIQFLQNDITNPSPIAFINLEGYTYITQ